MKPPKNPELGLCFQTPWPWLMPWEKADLCDTCIHRDNCPGRVGKAASVTQCKWGHEWTEATEIWQTHPKTGREYRTCRICLSEAQSRYRKRKTQEDTR